MKRWIGLGLVVTLLAGGICLLGNTAIDPGQFIGDWYGAADGQRYRFQEGIIICPEDGTSEMRGAYQFCGDRILLFIRDTNGNSQVWELYSTGEAKGEFLCDNPGGKGRILFSRSKIS